MSIGKAIKIADSRSQQIVTPRYRQWLRDHGDEAYPVWVMDRLYQLMTTTPRIRTDIFSASSAGQCLKRQEMSFLGIPTSTNKKFTPEQINLFNDGKFRHLRWQAALLACGVLDDIEYQAPWLDMLQTGHLDGVGTVPRNHPNQKWAGQSFIFELKGVSTYQYPKYITNNEVKQEHLMQGNRYSLLTGINLIVFLYEDKGADKWHEFIVEADPKIQEEQMKEIEELKKAVNTKTFHPMLGSCKMHMGKPWRECPYAGVGKVCETTKVWPI